MSDIGISYKATVTPSNLGVKFGLGFSGATLRATVKSTDTFTLLLQPTGNISEEILSTVAYPTAQTLTFMLTPLIDSLIKGTTFDVLTVLPSSVNIMGEQVTVAPVGDLQMSTQNGMLMVTGSLKVA